MKDKYGITMKAGRTGRAFQGLLIASIAAATLILGPAAARAADPAGSGPVAKIPPVSFESIPGSTAKRVILTAKAAERLGIETGRVGEEPVLLKQMVSGLVIPPMESQPKPKPIGGVFGGFGRGAAAPSPSPVAGEVWVLVMLSPAEWERLSKDKPARLLPLGTSDKSGKAVFARPSGMEPLEDMKRSMLSLYYVVPGKQHGLAVNNRVRVELQLSGSDERKKVAPYGAVYYDAKGDPWVYVNTKPLVFERRRVGVERVVGDLAVLSDGPPVGTPVVTVGAALLYGTEIFGK